MNTPDTVTPPPNIRQPHTNDLSVTRSEVESLVNAKMSQFATDLEARLSAFERRADYKQRARTYGVGGVAGLAVGVAGTLIVQRLRRKPAKP